MKPLVSILISLCILGVLLLIKLERHQHDAFIKELDKGSLQSVNGETWHPPEDSVPIRVRAVTLNGDRIYWDGTVPSEGRVGRFDMTVSGKTYVVWVQIPPEVK